MEMGPVAEDQTLACLLMWEVDQSILWFLKTNTSYTFCMDTASEANIIHVVFTLMLCFSKSLEEHSNKSTKFFFMIKDYDTLTFDHYYIFSFNNDKSIDKIIQC